MKHKSYLFYTFLGIMVLLLGSCKDEKDRPAFPLSAEIFRSIDGYQVAFTALTHSAVSWSWDFGDGNTSTEQNPVHVYESGGYYLATLTATSNTGQTVTRETKLAVSLDPFSLLTGDQTAEGYNGKTWKLRQAHSVNDKLVNSDATFTLMDPDIESLPSGAFDLYLGLGEAYNDQFTFHNNGTYMHNTTDGSSFGGIVYAMLLQQLGVAQITKTGGRAVFGQDAFALTTYSPEPSGGFILTEQEDFTIPTIPNYATSVVPPGIPVVTYNDVMTLEFTDPNAFIGVRDFHKKVIVQELTEESMRLVMFLTMSPAAIASQDPLIALATTAMILTFEVVR